MQLEIWKSICCIKNTCVESIPKNALQNQRFLVEFSFEWLIAYQITHIHMRSRISHDRFFRRAVYSVCRARCLNILFVAKSGKRKFLFFDDFDSTYKIGVVGKSRWHHHNTRALPGAFEIALRFQYLLMHFGICERFFICVDHCSAVGSILLFDCFSWAEIADWCINIRFFFIQRVPEIGDIPWRAPIDEVNTVQ